MIVRKRYADIFCSFFFKFEIDIDIDKFFESVKIVVSHRFPNALHGVSFNIFDGKFHELISTDISIRKSEISNSFKIIDRYKYGRITIFRNGFYIYINHAFGDMSMVYRFVHEVILHYTTNILNSVSPIVNIQSQNKEIVSFSQRLYQFIFGIHSNTNVKIFKVRLQVPISNVLRDISSFIHIDYYRQSMNIRNGSTENQPKSTGIFIDFQTLSDHNFDPDWILSSQIPETPLDQIKKQVTTGKRKIILLYSNLIKKRCIDEHDNLHSLRLIGLNYYITNLIYDIIIVNTIQYNREYYEVILNYTFKSHKRTVQFKQSINQFIPS